MLKETKRNGIKGVVPSGQVPHPANPEISEIKGLRQQLSTCGGLTLRGLNNTFIGIAYQICYISDPAYQVFILQFISSNKDNFMAEGSPQP